MPLNRMSMEDIDARIAEVLQEHIKSIKDLKS